MLRFSRLQDLTGWAIQGIKVYRWRISSLFEIYLEQCSGLSMLLDLGIHVCGILSPMSTRSIEWIYKTSH